MTGRNSSQRNVKGPSRLIAQVTPRSSAVKPTKSSTDDAEALANAAAKKVAAAREKKAAEKEAKDKAGGKGQGDEEAVSDPSTELRR